MADPELQIRGGGGGGSRSLDGGAVSKQIFFSPSMPQFGLKIRGGPGPPGPPSPTLDPPLGTARRDLTAIETYRQPKWKNRHTYNS